MIMKILVVDDSDDSRELTEAALRSAGYTDVRCASSAAEAFRALGFDRGQASAPAADIVLLDIVMPEIDGIEACAHIRSHASYQDVPIIMVTSLDDMDSLASAFVAGANDYITKPVNRIELTARVRAALRLKSELEQRRARERELLDFVSGLGDRSSTVCVDEATGLFAGAVAEAYLAAGSRFDGDEMLSVITVLIDRLDAVRRSQGEKAARAIQAKVARAIRPIAASVGVVAAAYRNGLIVIIAPETGPVDAAKLAQTIRAAIARLDISNREFIASDRVSASAAVVSARVQGGADRVKLLMKAIAGVQRSAAAGGDRILAVPA
jgi:sigma-B regulation protein RsbU (phosphoserine phosphatase)